MLFLNHFLFEFFIFTISALFVLDFMLGKDLYLVLQIRKWSFQVAFTEIISLENGVPLFVHYHHIIYSSRDKNFENNYGNFRVIYYESVNSSFMVYKFYLEMICRVIFNNVIKKHFTDIVV